MVPRRKGEIQTSISSHKIYNLIQNTDPTDLVVWETILIVEKDDIERHLLHYNQGSFRAAAESPCGNGVIHDAITFSSLSPEATTLLSGMAGST